ncbi:MAG: hypothetical protein KF887_10600 [Paracoccaceae bacterium]|nr:MAG: hypothetical protein KF887_10600 [Paracoccaceae bacterium]
MYLTETGLVPGAALPLAALKDHLRLGSGFADDAVQDGLAEGYLRAALATIEGRTAKVLIARDFRLALADWREAGEQPLPVAPVVAVAAVRLVDAAGAETTVAVDRWRLVPDAHRPRIVAAGHLLPMVPSGGRIEIDFTAGFGAWDAVPADLAQAVFLLAAEYYEMRHEGGMRHGEGLPQAVQALVARWRTVRILGGAR